MEVSSYSILVIPFLDGIHSSYIGFGGAVPILLFYYFVNRKHLSWGAAFWLGLLIYIVSLGTGVGLQGLVDDRASAFIAGVWGPIVYGLIASVFIHKSTRFPKKEKTDLDHFVEH